MLELVLGSKTAALIFLHLYHNGGSYPTAVSKDFGITLGQVQRQFDRFENAGIVLSTLVGRTRSYQFNLKSAAARKFMELVKIIYDSIPRAEREIMFKTRRRPRVRGKPVIGRKSK